MKHVLCMDRTVDNEACVVYGVVDNEACVVYGVDCRQ